MSVLIKGMKIPNNCADCYLNHDAVCYVENRVVMDDCYDRRATWCPLIEVPDQVAETNIFDTEETYHGCTVQVLSNSVTGETSIGWWRSDGSD